MAETVLGDGKTDDTVDFIDIKDLPPDDCAYLGLGLLAAENPIGAEVRDAFVRV